MLDNGAVRLNETFSPLERQRSRGSGRKDPAGRPGGSFCFLVTFAALRNNLRAGRKKERVAEKFHSLQPTPLSLCLSRSFPSASCFIFFPGISDGEGAGASGRGAHGESGRGGEAFTREATIRRRIVWERRKRQQQREQPRSFLPSALQSAQVGCGMTEEEAATGTVPVKILSYHYTVSTSDMLA